MKKFLIPAFLVAFSVASVQADDPFYTRAYNAVYNGAAYCIPDCVSGAYTSVDIEGRIARNPKTAFLVAFIAGAATVKAVNYYAASNNDEDSGF